MFTKRIGSGGIDRVIGRCEGELVNHHQRQCLSLHIHSLPETHGAHQNGVAVLAKGVDQRCFGHVALHEKRIRVPCMVEQRPELLGRFADGRK